MGMRPEVDAKGPPSAAFGSDPQLMLEPLFRPAAAPALGAHTPVSSPRYAFLTSGWADRRGSAARDQAARHEHRDTVGEPEHRVHVVLDQQHGDACADALEKRKSYSPTLPVPCPPSARRGARAGGGWRAPGPLRARAVRRARGWPRPRPRARRAPISRAIARASSKSSASEETGRQKEKLEPLPAWTASARLSSTVKRLNRLVI